LETRYIEIPAFGSVVETYRVYYSGTATRIVRARINGEHMFEEKIYTNNVNGITVTPIGELLDSTYDFSLSNFSASPSTIYQGNTITVSFTTKNKNYDISYYNIPIDIFVDNVKTETFYVSYAEGASINHSYPILIDSCGTHSIAAVVNLFNREFENDQSDNTQSTIVTINPYYEFSISELTVTPSTCNEGETISVKIRTDSWDNYNGYDNIPVELFYNGKLLSTLYVSYVPYGANDHTFTVNVGSVVGANTINIRVNWGEHLNEVNPNNNTATTTIMVNRSLDLSIFPVVPNASYNEGTEVITTYYVYNMGNHNIIPSDFNSVVFQAYYYKTAAEKVQITITSKTEVVIPKNGSNLVYFKWTVPNNIAGKTVYCVATINSSGIIFESDRTNNTATFTPTISKVTYMETPDTIYEEKPSNWSKPNNPVPIAGNNSWAEWQYESGSFVKKYYGLSATASVALTPDVNAFSSWQKDSEWYMRSGYSFSVIGTAKISSLGSTYTLPSSNAYTVAQNGNVYFPEFKYLSDIDKYRTLEFFNGSLQFYKNENSVDNYRIHFTPVWTPNGTYTVSCKLYDLWTPVGMITTSGSGHLNIEGSMYNDWYVTHR